MSLADLRSMAWSHVLLVAGLPLRRLTTDPLISSRVSHCAGKVLAETAKSETVCKPMRRRGRAENLHPLHQWYIQDITYYIVIYLHDQIHFHISWYFHRIIHHLFIRWSINPWIHRNQWKRQTSGSDVTAVVIAPWLRWPGKKRWRFEDASCTWGCFLEGLVCIGFLNRFFIGFSTLRTIFFHFKFHSSLDVIDEALMKLR